MQSPTDREDNMTVGNPDKGETIWVENPPKCWGFSKCLRILYSGILIVLNETIQGLRGNWKSKSPDLHLSIFHDWCLTTYNCKKKSSRIWTESDTFYSQKVPNWSKLNKWNKALGKALFLSLFQRAGGNRLLYLVCFFLTCFLWPTLSVMNDRKCFIISQDWEPW